MQLVFCHIPVPRQRDAQVLPLDMGSGHIINLSLAGCVGWNKAQTAYWKEALHKSLDDYLVGHPFGLIQPGGRLQSHTMRLETEVGNQQETFPRAGYVRVGSLGSPVQVTGKKVVWTLEGTEELG